MMRFIKDENGQGMLEYVLIIAIIALVLIAALVIIKNKIKEKDLGNNIANKIDIDE